MKLSVQAVQKFSVPKRGSGADENDDAYGVGERLFAIADGAAETSFSERWARSLVDRFIIAPPSPFAASDCEFPRWLEPLQREWHEGIEWARLPWFAESKAHAGAFAAFLGLEFVEGQPLERTGEPESPPPERLKWRAMAIGDSCLFQVRQDELVRSFPLQRADQFNSRPILVSSNPPSNEHVWENIFPDGGEAQFDDIFFLATDALAHWFLAQYEAGRTPWTTLCGLKNEDDFESLVAQLRAADLMRNDDTTLLTIRWSRDDLSGVEQGGGQAEGVASQAETEIEQEAKTEEVMEVALTRQAGEKNDELA